LTPIRRGLAALGRVEVLGGAKGPYALQAALAACHARARKAEETDWKKIAALYDTLRQVMPSPVVDLNRAVAYSMAFSPEVGLTLLGEIDQAKALQGYAPLPAAKGDFLFRMGRLAEAKGPVRACRRTHPQRARKSFPSQASGSLRLLTSRMLVGFLRAPAVRSAS
jgi:predicted RNA polymerase sigma factor